jgi:hypothetical protein
MAPERASNPGDTARIIATRAAFQQAFRTGILTSFPRGPRERGFRDVQDRELYADLVLGSAEARVGLDGRGKFGDASAG